MTRVLGLALYGPLAASSRQRLAQYIPGLRENGIELTLHHLLGDTYLQRRVFGHGSLPFGTLLCDGWERLRRLCSPLSYDAIVLHCELFPFMPAWLERLLMRRPYVYDMDDAFYMKYRSGRWRALSGILGSKFESVMRGAAAVTAGSRVLADYAVKHNPRTRLLPTVVDTSRYVTKPHDRGQEFVVGWIGSPSTAAYLRELVAPLEQLGTEGPVRLVVIGGPAPPIANIVVEEIRWSEVTEIEDISRFDVGVMPLPDDVWARGKCAFKLIQYLACGIPAVASAVGANVDVLEGGSGLLARTDAEWLACLRQIRDFPAEARQMGEIGRARVASRYSLQHNLPELVRIIQTLQG